MALQEFRHFAAPQRIYHGTDSLDSLRVELMSQGCRRPVVFSGRTLGSTKAIVELISCALGGGPVDWFNQVKAHSPINTVLQAAHFLRDARADAIIALGGGSSIVTARSAAIVLAEGEDLHSLCTQISPGQRPISPKLLKPKLPLFVIPSTATTAMVKAGSAVLDVARGRRLTLYDPKTRARALFIHPEVICTAAPELALGAALNAFSMAIEGLESNMGNPLADASLLHALRMLWSGIPCLLQTTDIAANRSRLILGAVLCGQGTDNSGAGLASVLSYCLGARLSLNNGISNAILLPHTMRFNAPATQKRLVAIARTLTIAHPGKDLAGACSEAIAAQFRQIGVPQRLRDVGVAQPLLATLAEDALSDWFLQQVPRPIKDATDLMDILQAAW